MESWTGCGMKERAAREILGLAMSQHAGPPPQVWGLQRVKQAGLGPLGCFSDSWGAIGGSRTKHHGVCRSVKQVQLAQMIHQSRLSVPVTGLLSERAPTKECLLENRGAEETRDQKFQNH
jgi:hypothetical protein